MRSFALTFRRYWTRVAPEHDEAAEGLGRMADSERSGVKGCGWLLVIIGVLAAGVAVIVWLTRFELEQERSGIRVWVTDSGSRYHERDCPALARSEPRSVTLAEARSAGRKPCDLCGPPA